jgi:hypothetical protein
MPGFDLAILKIERPPSKSLMLSAAAPKRGEAIWGVGMVARDQPRSEDQRLYDSMNVLTFRLRAQLFDLLAMAAHDPSAASRAASDSLRKRDRETSGNPEDIEISEVFIGSLIADMRTVADGGGATVIRAWLLKTAAQTEEAARSEHVDPAFADTYIRWANRLRTLAEYPRSNEINAIFHAWMLRNDKTAEDLARGPESEPDVGLQSICGKLLGHGVVVEARTSIFRATAPAIRGMSGGAIVNRRGELLGVLFERVDGGGSFAVRTDSILNAFPWLETPYRSRHN